MFNIVTLINTFKIKCLLQRLARMCSCKISANFNQEPQTNDLFLHFNVNIHCAECFSVNEFRTNQ